MHEAAGLSRALLLALVANTAYAALAAAFVWTALRVLRPRSAVVHETAWALILLRLVLPPSLHSPLSARAVLDWILPRPTSWDLVNATDGPSFASAARIATGAVPVIPDVCWLLGAGAWFGGMVAGSLLLATRRQRFCRIAAQAAPVSEPHLLECVESWRRDLGIARPVRLVSSEAGLVPFTTGLLRPVVFLPGAVLTWRHEEVAPIIAHEMTHVRRWDEARIVLADAVALIHFFNPLGWITVSRLARAREKACDQRVLSARRVSPQGYARSLIAVLRLSVLGSTPPSPALGLVSRKDNLTMRIKEILTAHAHQPGRTFAALGITLAAACALLPMAGATSSGPPGSPTVQPSPAPRSLPSEHPAAIVSPAPSGKKKMPPFVEVGKNVKAPSPIHTPGPVFPEEARKARTHGRVVLECVIDETGAVTEARAIRSQPNGLTEAAIAAVRQWRYEPATLGGAPVPVYLTVTIEFRPPRTDKPAKDPTPRPTT